MIITLFILLITIVFFVSGKIRSDIVALCSLVLLMICGILTPTEALCGFSSSVVIMMIGLFVVGGAIFQTGLARMLSQKILKLAGGNQTLLFILIILGTALIGGFVSNTGTVAIMLPIVVSMSAAANVSASRFLMPLAFASSMGGMLTLIGTPPNLIISDTLVHAGLPALSFFSFLPVGAICIGLGLIMLLPLSKLLVKNKTEKQSDHKEKTLIDLAKEYQLSQNLFRVKLPQQSIVAGKQLQELEIPMRYGLQVMEIRRPSTSQKNPFFKTIHQTDQKVAEAETVLVDGDILYVSGVFTNVQRFANDYALELIDAHQTEEKTPVFAGKLRFDNIGIAEVLLMPNSHLVNRAVKQSGFREKYKLNILGIQRREKYILQDLRDEKIQPGDVLLVQGEWHNIERMSADSTEWVVAGKPLLKSQQILSHKAPLAAVILVAMVISLAINIIPAVLSVIIAALLMVLLGCFRNVEDAYKTINWETVVLIAAMLPLGVALEKTGVVALITKGLVDGLGDFSPYVLLAGIYFSTSLLTMFISNTATAVLFAPIALYAAQAIGVNPVPFLFAVAVASSMCFASPFSTPPNALVMSAGRYTFMDYIRVGLPLQIIFGVVMVIILPLIYS
ncbi:MAG: SLC13 family permease [Culturomica sp.]|jgi:di/tricarboxylate transporter|nr:SLC13 family permease [Culturomica sp.]